MTIKIHCEIAPKLNYACQQNAFPLLHDMQIENEDVEEGIDNLVVTLSSNPEFFEEKSWTGVSIGPGNRWHLPMNDRDIRLKGEYLRNLNDSERGDVTITVKQGDSILRTESKKVTLLAYNEWGGAGYMPELLAAFCMPNDPAVDKILGDASLILREAGRPDGIDGYTVKSRERVWEIASAIYTAIAKLKITYTQPPASFEQDGQKIRLPTHIVKNRVGTCLDTTMLFAAALEQAGLNPLVVLPKEHAIVGVWLKPESLATIFIDEAEMLRKRIDLNELILIETTYLTKSPLPNFSIAIESAREKVNVDLDSSFNAAVDIRRARAHQILPLPMNAAEALGETAKDDVTNIPSGMDLPPYLPNFDKDDEPIIDTPEGRLERWQRKLLDLSARNPLLNYKSKNDNIKIICPDPGLLEDKLASGSKISIQSAHKLLSQEQDEEIHRQRTGGEKILEGYARDALGKEQILVDIPKDKLDNRAVDIYRKSQSALREGGANTLYLALGFLLWKKNEKDERQFRAPLILMPVTMERTSVRSGVKILAHDDEPRLNPTLLQMLKQDFDLHINELGGDLPKDNNGIDVNKVWNKIRSGVKDSPGFEVVEDVVLGHFSFAKYLMWKDLVDRTDALRTSAIVKHLLDKPREPYLSDIPFVAGHEIDQQFKPSDLWVPLPADSSQIAAIATADKGKDFIIIGPPGTGKSQTISNMIAHLMGKGKTVLFVSEKTAALEVVYRRLNEIGLGRFCLELHSNKAKKTDVLSQLSIAWDTHQNEKIKKDWEREAENLRRLRDRLNLVVDRLHHIRRNGMTAHYAMGIKVRDSDLAARLKFSWPTADQHDETVIKKMRDAVSILAVQVGSVGDVSKSPFHLVEEGEWSPQLQEQIINEAHNLSAASAQTSRACESFLNAIGINIPDRSLERLDALSDLATVMADSYRKQTAFALEPDGQDKIEALEEAVKNLNAYAKAQATLSCVYDPMAWRQIDGDDLARRWQDSERTWWLKKLFLRHAIKKIMKKGGAKGAPNPAHDSPLLKELRIRGESIDSLDKQLSKFKDWKGHTTSPESLSAICSLGVKAKASIGKLTDAQSFAEVKDKIRTLMQDANDLLAPDAAVGRNAHAFMTAYAELQQSCQKFEKIAGGTVSNHFLETNQALDAIQNTTQNIIACKDDLRAWCSWRRRRAEAMDIQLGPLVDAIENGRVPTDEIEDTFNAAYCDWWSSAIIGEDEVLRTFSTPEHTADIESFRNTDEKFQQLTSAYIAANLSGNIPNRDGIEQPSWGILNREIQKKSKHMPVRQLIQKIPDVLTALSPCLMMSPLSVAQYLPAGQQLFDVVIFDEASQITTWDAIGALARGRQVIVAGDPKQMPPTNFFSRSNEPDEDVDEEGDLESILDEMLVANISQKTLNLHYRSRRESLIAFSNNRYYNDSLITFPAPVCMDRGVRLIRTEGYYSRGKARTNTEEAKAIVKEILRRLKNEDEKVRNLSIGVVTFNSEQQNLIENLLDKERSKNPDIEWAFSSEKTEHVFVKTLETVQGDERDVILFSITYGPDESGHITMNFGPLNNQGGERRLNVAMTRARSEMIVFSTLDPAQIALSRTQARAVRDLKHFLQYAEQGPSFLRTAVYGSVGDFDSPLESAIARALRDKGWEVTPQVGVSAYRIDLGVVHPNKPGVYLAGIECDGAMYHSSAYARERDKIRQSVLEGLGWTIFRVWSTDWWTNKQGALDTLNASLQDALDNE